MKTSQVIDLREYRNRIIDASLVEIEDYVNRIDKTNNKDLYYKASPSVKKNYSFVMYLINSFKNDYEFIKTVASYALEDLNTRFASRKNFGKSVSKKQTELLELLITMSKLELENREETYFSDKLYYYTHTINSLIKISKINDEEGVITSFDVIDTLYPNSDIIKTYFAKKISKAILFEINLEKTVHQMFKRKEDFLKYKNKTIYDILFRYDKSLADYVLSTNKLDTMFENEVTMITANWDEYEEKVNYENMEQVLTIADNIIEAHDLEKKYDGEYLDGLIYFVLEELELDHLFEEYAYIEGLYFNFEKYKLYPINVDDLNQDELDFMELLKKEISNYLKKDDESIKPKIIQLNNN